MQEKVTKVLDKLRPYLMNDGGNISLVKIENDIVYVSFEGACQGCPMREITLKNGIETAIKQEVPEVKEVKLVND